MAKKLYVGNLSYKTTEQSLRDLFSQAGTVISTSIIIDKMTGKSRGFGFAEMEDADAAKAIEMFHGKEVEGRTLTVNEARPLAPRENRGGRM
jgi:RNA recognition motif-containing protein